MSADERTPAREILRLGPYGGLGTGVVDAVAANPAWRVVTAARRPAPAYRDPDGVRHINVDLSDCERTREILTKLDTVTDLVFAAYVEKPTMAETVEPNARMFRNALDAFSARNTPLQRVVLAGGAKSYGFHLGSFNAPAKESQPRLIAPIHYHQQEDILKAWSEKTGTSWTVLRPHVNTGPSLNSPMNLVTGVAVYAAMSRELGLPLRFPGRQAGWNSLQQACDAELFGRATLLGGSVRRTRRTRSSTSPTAMCIVGDSCGTRSPTSTRSRWPTRWPCRLPRRWPRKGRCGIPWSPPLRPLPNVRT